MLRKISDPIDPGSVTAVRLLAADPENLPRVAVHHGRPEVITLIYCWSEADAIAAASKVTVEVHDARAVLKMPSP